MSSRENGMVVYMVAVAARKIHHHAKKSMARRLDHCSQSRPWLFLVDIPPNPQGPKTIESVLRFGLKV